MGTSGAVSLSLLIKTDVQGSAEALKDAVEAISHLGDANALLGQPPQPLSAASRPWQ